MIQSKPLHIPSTVEVLPGDWSWSRLDDACEGVYDCPHSTPILIENGPLVVRSQDMRSGVLRTQEAGRVSEETYRERIAKAEPRHGDLLYSREGTYFGIAAEVPQGFRVCLGQRMVLIRPKPGMLNFRFLRYWLNSPALAMHVHGLRDGTVAERLNLPTIRGLPIAVPPIRQQELIADSLSSLEDKIELNRSMNGTLEAMARTLFRSWFVDFDPVRAKADGRKPLGMDSDVAGLFPKEFSESEIGQIPRGWKAGRLDDVATNPRRGVDPSDVTDDTPYIGLEHMPRKSISLTEWGHAEDLASNKFRFQRGEILFGKLRPYFHKVGVAPVDGICSTDILVICPSASEWFGLVLGYCSSAELVSHADASSTGTKMPRTSWADLARYPIAVPDSKVASRFTEQVEPLVEAIRSNILESRTLASMRDTLLPRLLSGELRIKDTVRLVEAAT